MLVPAQSAKNLRRLAALGLEGDYGFFDAVDYTDRGEGPGAGLADTANPVIVRTYMAHHQGMTLVALANALLDDRMVARFHLDSRVQATELLLQERLPRDVPAPQRPHVDDLRVTAPPPLPFRRYRTPHTVFPHAQFLSNGRLVSVVTNAGGGQPVARWRGGDPIAPRSPRSIREASSSTCATCGAATSGRRPTIRRRSSRTTTSRPSVRTARRFAAATARSSASSTSPCRPRTTSKCGGSRSPIRARARARST